MYLNQDFCLLQKVQPTVTEKGIWIRRSNFELISGRARIFKLLQSPRIDSKEQIPPGWAAWRVGTTTLFLVGS